MTDLFLIAHKVHGLPAFDIATQMECPMCGDDSTERTECVECDGLGFWWIIPTSGHRAYPWWHCNLDHMMDSGSWPGDMPPGLPDHYPHHSAPTISLAEALGIRSKPAAPIIRRF